MVLVFLKIVAVVAFPLRAPVNPVEVIDVAPLRVPVRVAPFIVGVVSVLLVNV